MIRRLLALFALCAAAVVVAAGCDGMPPSWDAIANNTSDPFAPLWTPAEKAMIPTGAKCVAPPWVDGCVPNVQTGVCVPDAAAACAASAGDSACVACAKSKCCAEALSCFGTGNACACLVQARTDGNVPACGADAGAEAAYKDEAGCLAKHCAATCPAFAGSP